MVLSRCQSLLPAPELASAICVADRDACQVCISALSMLMAALPSRECRGAALAEGMIEVVVTCMRGCAGALNVQVRYTTLTACCLHPSAARLLPVVTFVSYDCPVCAGCYEYAVCAAVQYRTARCNPILADSAQCALSHLHGLHDVAPCVLKWLCLLREGGN